MTAGRAGIASSDPRATAAGATVLREGGNAVDAAIAAALVQLVVEPHHCGIGGDAFLLLHVRDRDVPIALDGSGAIPAGLTPAALERDGHDAVPGMGAASLSVPGAIDLFAAALETHGTRSLGALLQPAIAFAGDGFAVRPTLASASAQMAGALANDPVLSRLFLRDGRPLAVGDVVVNPRLGALLRAVADRGVDAFYRGDVAREIEDVVAAAGGYLTAADLAAHETTPMDPVSTEFQGTTAWALPEPTQGPAVLAALESLERGGDLGWRAVVEAVVEGLVTTGVDLRGPAPNTTYIAAIDGSGAGASLITSVFAPFGSGLGVDGIGGPLQNRAAGFRVIGQPPRPGKPPHTIIPGLITGPSGLAHVLGVAGGLMQAQGQVQLAIRLVAERRDPQDAIDAPRFRALPGGALAVEPGHPLGDLYPDAVGADPGFGGFGGAQVASSVGHRVRCGADGRRQGAAAVIDG